MRQDSLLCLRNRRFVRTTNFRHGLGVYPNLVPEAESFIATLKYEEVYLWEYRDMMAAWESIHRFIEKVYN